VSSKIILIDKLSEHRKPLQQTKETCQHSSIQHRDQTDIEQVNDQNLVPINDIKHALPTSLKQSSAEDFAAQILFGSNDEQMYASRNGETDRSAQESQNQPNKMRSTTCFCLEQSEVGWEHL